jgi:predicted nuclease with TOPRIM domain
MQKEERELIQEKFKGVYLHQESNFNLINEKLEQIYKQTSLTNSRVNKLEDKMSKLKLIEIMYDKPLLLIIIILGIVFLTSIIDLTDLLKLI